VFFVSSYSIALLYVVPPLLIFDVSRFSIVQGVFLTALLVLLVELHKEFAKNLDHTSRERNNEKEVGSKSSCHMNQNTTSSTWQRKKKPQATKGQYPYPYQLISPRLWKHRAIKGGIPLQHLGAHFSHY